jgi:hypothetical protein
VAIKSLSDEHHIARHCPKNRIILDGEVVIILPQAFLLRPGERYLSAAWMEYYAGSKLEKVHEIVATTRKKRAISDKDGFVIGNVGAIKEACADFGQKVRVNHAPKDWHKGYATVSNYKSDSIELLSILATEAWGELVRVRDCTGPK